MSKTVTQNIVETLQAEGLLPAANQAAAEKVVDELTRPNFIPGGPAVRMDQLVDWTRCEPGYRCCRQTGNDIQSGPYFCGDPAEAKARHKDDADAVVCTCRRHTPWAARQALGL